MKIDNVFSDYVNVKLDGADYTLRKDPYNRNIFLLERGKKGKKEGKVDDKTLAGAILRASAKVKREGVRARRESLERFFMPLEETRSTFGFIPKECAGCGSGPGCIVCRRVETRHGPMLFHRSVAVLGVVVQRHDFSWLYQLSEQLKLGVTKYNFPRQGGLSPVEEECLVIKDVGRTFLIRGGQTLEDEIPSWQKQMSLFEEP